MSYRKSKPTRLAKRIAQHLFTEVHNPTDLYCISTGSLVKGCHNYTKMSDITPNAIGGYYFAFGYYYILCLDNETGNDYISIHSDTGSHYLVGTMENIREIRVFRDAKITG